MAKLADALDLGSSGQPYGFKSLQLHQSTEFMLGVFCCGTLCFQHHALRVNPYCVAGARSFVQAQPLAITFTPFSTSPFNCTKTLSLSSVFFSLQFLFHRNIVNIVYLLFGKVVVKLLYIINVRSL